MSAASCSYSARVRAACAARPPYSAAIAAGSPLLAAYAFSVISLRGCATGGTTSQARSAASPSGVSSYVFFARGPGPASSAARTHPAAASRASSG
ncbi:hypothetical protein ACFQY4_27925 [Catellatospora bangladeshensis]|uniref:hypothetical protein n=1 Tax=Catellatospora bangladeshensis TaxID=310355 RepID=UPI00360B79F5